MVSLLALLASLIREAIALWVSSVLSVLSVASVHGMAGLAESRPARGAPPVVLSRPIRPGARYPGYRAPGGPAAGLAHMTSASRHGGEFPLMPTGPGLMGSMRANDRRIIRWHATFGDVRRLPSVVRSVGPYSRGFCAFIACLAMADCGILLARETPNQVGEVHTAHALLTSSLSHRRRGPGPTWGFSQKSGVTGVESRWVSVCPEVTREQGS